MMKLNLVIVRNNIKNNKLKYNKERHWIESVKRNQEATTTNSQDIF